MKFYPKTINLTRVKEGNHYESILRMKFDYDVEIKERIDLDREFERQKLVAEKLYQKKSAELISAAVEGVKNFVIKSMNLNGTSLFDRTKDQVHGEILQLDMQLSDHEMTYASIGRAVKKLVTNLHVVRLKANQARKRSISELLEPTKQSRRIFVIVEQTECLSRVLTEALVGLLRNRLSDSDSPTDTIMVLFCLSLRLKALPFDNMHCFGRMKGIHKQTDRTESHNLVTLLKSPNLRVKLGPTALDFIYEHSLNNDSSITSTKYLHIYALFEHYEHIDADSILSQAEYELLDIKHQSLCDDMLCLSSFLKAKDLWPTDASDIYTELETYSDLTQSHLFFDAMSRIKKLDHGRLVKRFENFEKEFSHLGSPERSTKQNAAAILLSYKEKIVNNKDCDEILAKLINDVMKYAKQIRCPFEKQDNFYFNNIRSLDTDCFTASRRGSDLPMTYLDESSYFGILFNRILNSMGSMAAGELCDEVFEDFKKLIDSRDATSEKSQESVPSKRSRRTINMKVTSKQTNRANSSEDKDGLARAIFVDMIDSMEHQGIIKLDARAKGKVVKRLAWPLMDKSH